MMKEIEVFVMVDEAGDCAVSTDRETLQEAWENDIGSETGGTRILRIVLQVELPKVTELSADVPANSAKATMTVR